MKKSDCQGEQELPDSATASSSQSRWKWWAKLFLGSAFVSILGRGFPADVVQFAEAAGQALGIVLAAAALAMVPTLLLFIVGKLNYRRFMVLMTICCAIAAMATLTVAIYEQGNGNAYATDDLSLPKSSHANFTDYGFVHHRDDENLFSVWFPKSWSMVPASHSETKLKIVSENGDGVDDLNIGVRPTPALKMTTPSEYAKSLANADAFVEKLQTRFADITLIEHGPTHVSSQPAYYYITGLTIRSFGLDFPTKQLQVFTLHNGLAYTITFRTAPERFEQLLPVYKIILGGFVLKPAPQG